MGFLQFRIVQVSNYYKTGGQSVNMWLAYIAAIAKLWLAQKTAVEAVNKIPTFENLF